MLYAIFFNSSGPVVQVPCPSGHTVTGRFYKNSVLKKVKEFYNKKQPSKGWTGVHLLHDNTSSHKCEVVKSFYDPAYSKNSGRALSVTPVRPVRPYDRPNLCPGHNS